MTYRKQYFTLQYFITKAGRLVKSKRLEAATQGRLDAFVAYKNIWNADKALFKVFHILIQKGYKNIVREIILTYGKRPIEILKTSPFNLFLTIKDLAKQDDVELLDLLYQRYLIKLGKPFPRGYIYQILNATTGNKVLQWVIDNDIINNETVDIMHSIFIRDSKDKLRIIKFLAEHDIFPTIKDINDSFVWPSNGNISPATLDFLINKGIITPTVEMANLAAKYGKINILKLLAKRKILPDSRGANNALRSVYPSRIMPTLDFLINKGIITPTVEIANLAAEYGAINSLKLLAKRQILPDSRGANNALRRVYGGRSMPTVKWMYEQGIKPNDKAVLRSILFYSDTMRRKDVSEKNKWLNSAFGDLL